MKNSAPSRLLLTSLVLLALLALAKTSAAPPEDGSTEGLREDAAVLDEELLLFGDNYESGEAARVRYQINGLTIQRAALNRRAAADINSPVFPGDTVLTAFDQRAEIELAGGSLVRISSNTEVTFLALPDPYADFRDSTVLQVASGTVRIDAALSDDEEFRIDTPGGSIYVMGDGDFRVEVVAGGRTRVISRRGVVEVSSQGGSVLLRAGMQTELFAGQLPADPTPFNTFASDGFDEWVDLREGGYRASETTDEPLEDDVYESLPEEVQPYYEELADAGDWEYTAEYGYVWQPSGVEDDWQPYYDGHWTYGSGGYFWVSYEYWGWAPYHYGRWTYYPTFGWSWIPGRTFGGAWVAWSWGRAYLGWCPLGYWNYPVYHGPVYHGHYATRTWTFVPYQDLGQYDHVGYKTRLKVDEVHTELKDQPVVTRAPRVAPTELVASVDARKTAQRVASNDPTALPETVRKTTTENFQSKELRKAQQRLLAGDSAARPFDFHAAPIQGDPVAFDAAGEARQPTETVGAAAPTVPSSSAPRRFTTDPRSTLPFGARRERSEPPVEGYERVKGSVEPPQVRLRQDPAPRKVPAQIKPQPTDPRDVYRKMASPRKTQRYQGPLPQAGSSREAPTRKPTVRRTPAPTRKPSATRSKSSTKRPTASKRSTTSFRRPTASKTRSSSRPPARKTGRSSGGSRGGKKR